ncbi:MAG: hypothetical protein II996_06915 [Oscillospiraceae bacterium]|nr:hypothetical protein [Oscillospiraceae bacterium]MBQ4545284.1 hypothetical protein [Oscillospiraceae bacterium]MBQ6901467.1 hypothetical protein [Oscillospiraceae bacterium]
MNELAELEHILTDIDCLADTFLAMDIANQTDALSLPECSLTVPAEALKKYAKSALELHTKLLNEPI